MKELLSRGKRGFSFALAFLMLFSVMTLGLPQAEAAMLPESGGSCNIRGYVLATSGNVRVYTNAACTRGGNEYITAATDECYITKIDTANNSLYVSYPTSNGRKSRWVPASAFTTMPGALTGTPVVANPPSSIKAYKKNNTSSVYGTIYRGDQVFMLETSGSMTRVAYNISGGYKLAWVVTSQLCPFADGVYKIHSKYNSNLCVDVASGSTASWANVQLYESNRNSNAQIFRFHHEGNGYYKIENAGSGLCVTIDGSSSGSNVVQLPWYGMNSQQWQIIPTTSNGFYLRSKSGLVLDIQNGNITSGRNIWAYSFNGSNAQQFVFTSTTPVAGAVTQTTSTVSSTMTSTEQGVLTRIEAMLNGTYGGSTYKVNTRYWGPFYSEQCKGFAKQVHKLLFGYNIGSTYSKPNNYKIGISSNNTKCVGSLTDLSDTNLKNLFSQGRPGDFIQLRRTHSGSHSMILMSKNDSGITVCECNLDGRNTIVKKTYSWANLRNANAGLSLYTANNYWLH